MSANLGALLKRLDPKLRIQVYEAADELAYESSNGWNNAGTGHAGICEISYTPITKDGSPVKVQKVIDIFQEFEQTLQFWGHAVASGMKTLLMDGKLKVLNGVTTAEEIVKVAQVEGVIAP